MDATRGNTEVVPVFIGRAMNKGQQNSYSDGFPLGEGIRRLICRANFSLTIGTGTGAIAEGELLLIKSLNFRSNRGDKFFNMVPGRALWRIDQVKSGTLNYKDAVAASTAVYTVQWNMWFSDPLLNPDERDRTILDTSRYDSVAFDITFGTEADILTTPGTSVLTITMDMYAERYRGVLPANRRPKDMIEYTLPASINPTAATELNFEKGADLAIKRAYLTAFNSATLGTPFTGTPSDTTLADISVDTSDGKFWDTLVFAVAGNMNKAEYTMESKQTGQVVIDFVKDGNLDSAVFAGGKSRFKIQWTNGTLSTSQVSAVIEGIRPLRGTHPLEGRAA